MEPLNAMIEDLFYTFYHDYGTVVTIKRLTKRDVDPNTGVREDDSGYTLDAVFTPVGMMNQYLVKMLGREDLLTTVFMVKLDTNQVIMPADTLIHSNIHYRNLKVQQYGTVAIVAGMGDK